MMPLLSLQSLEPEGVVIDRPVRMPRDKRLPPGIGLRIGFANKEDWGAHCRCFGQISEQIFAGFWSGSGGVHAVSNHFAQDRSLLRVNLAPISKTAADPLLTQRACKKAPLWRLEGEPACAQRASVQFGRSNFAWRDGSRRHHISNTSK